MQPGILVLILVSVGLSSFSQLMLKIGMTSAPVQQVLADRPGLFTTAWTILFSPLVFTGLFCFGLSAIFWIFVLSKIDVSYAYPCVALGIVLTVVAGHFFLGEQIPPARIAGLALILGGVSLVAFGR